METISIPTFIINLKRRIDRKKNIEKEFEGRSEFIITFIEACEHSIGAVGLWKTMKNIIQVAIANNFDYILICEDDHQFTENYSKDWLLHCIDEVRKKNADILIGGVNWFEDAVPVSNDLFWVNIYNGNQFIIIFNSFYNKILDAVFSEHDAADYKISALSSNKYYIHPFISVQKEFGYSDATSKNNGTNRMEDLFVNTSAMSQMLKDAKNFYDKLSKNTAIQIDHFENTIIPVYIINLAERPERLEHALKQFNGKTEFDVTVVNACKHEIGAFGLWQSIRKVIQLAIHNDDDVIIICEDDHEFTKAYSKEYLFTDILQAHDLGCDYMSGGCAKFDLIFRISERKFWTNYCLSTQFIIVYRKFFEKILNEPYDETVVGDIKLSQMTSNKMILYPYISCQKEFPYSDVTSIHNEEKGIVQRMFSNSERRIEQINPFFIEHKY